MSSHHSEQMSQRLKVSRIARCMSKVKVTDWVSQWQGHLLSCSGQLKINGWVRWLTNNWKGHQSILPDEYKNTFGTHGCEKSLPPPSSENKICEKFHEKIGQLRDDSNRDKFDEKFAKEFLERRPTESLLIPTDETNNNKTYCFSTETGPFGWCATCKVRKPYWIFEICPARSQEGGERILPAGQRNRPQKPPWSGLAKCDWGIVFYHFVETNLFESAGMGVLRQVMWNYLSGLWPQITKGECESSLRGGSGEDGIFASDFWPPQILKPTNQMTSLQVVLTTLDDNICRQVKNPISPRNVYLPNFRRCAKCTYYVGPPSIPS